MKIVVREPKLAIRIKDLGGDIEKVSVRARGVIERSKRVTKIHVKDLDDNDDEPTKQSIDWHQVFTLLPTILHGDDENEQTEQPEKALETSSEKGTETTAQQAVKTIEINFALPSRAAITATVKKAFAIVRGLRKKAPKKLAIAIGGTIVVAGIIVWLVSSRGTPATANGSASSTVSPPSLTKGTPNYATILPTGKTIKQLGGWVRISPANRNPAYAFLDKFNGVQLSVSEQPLPSKFQTNTNNQVNQIALSLGASSSFTAGSTLVYIGTMSNESQSVILAKDNLLILIKSASPLPNADWSTYINSLH